MAPLWRLCLLMLLQSSQVLCQWWGHRCRDKPRVILGFPPINCSTSRPRVLPKPGGYRSERLLLQVSESFECSFGRRNEPLENKGKLPRLQLGALSLGPSEVTCLTFPASVLRLFCAGWLIDFISSFTTATTTQQTYDVWNAKGN